MNPRNVHIVALVCAELFLNGCGSSSNDDDTASSTAMVDGTEVSGNLVRMLDFSQFNAATDALTADRMDELDELTRNSDLSGLRTALAADVLSSRELVLFYAARIQRNDVALASIIELNPDALAEADRLDAMHAAGEDSGQLHGLPILLKDNIATGDKLHNTAGAAVLADHIPTRGAFVSERLREAGALILGKTNLSEWANFLSSKAPNGNSVLGGQVVNPFGADLEVFGSSTGSAVAAATRFAAATVGTETSGSIIAPAAANGVAGMRPTLGLLSSNNIIPISASLDTAGPIARNVADLALMLTVMAARDHADPNTHLASGMHGTDFTRRLENTSLDGLTIGVPSISLLTESNPTGAVRERVIEHLTQSGANIVSVELPGEQVTIVGNGFLELLIGSFANDLAEYLVNANAPIESLDDVITFNDVHLDARAPFGQDLLIRSRDNSLKSKARDDLAHKLRTAALTAIDNAETEDGEPVDFLLTLDNTFSAIYAVAGVPAVTVPAGLDAEGQPHGATFVGLTPGSDAATLGVARAFERASQLREEPVLPVQFVMPLR